MQNCVDQGYICVITMTKVSNVLFLKVIDELLVGIEMSLGVRKPQLDINWIWVPMFLILMLPTCVHVPDVNFQKCSARYQ